jgi:dolichyl-phosphate-mannose-protein mannosyltransferase
MHVRPLCCAEMTATSAVDGVPARKRWTRVDWIAVVSLVTIAAVLRLLFLSDPHTLVFDETYYAKDACYYVEAATEPCGLETPQVEAHPPLGKWLIGAGIAVFGFDSFGWRVSAAITGSLTVLLTYLLARRLLSSTLGAGIASLLLALDFLHFVQSRVAMLDVFVATFGLAAVLFALYDRDYAATKRRVLGLSRPWRAAAGVAAGAAFASKWSGAFFVLMVIVLVIAWDMAAAAASEGGLHRRHMLRRAVSILVWLVLLPIAVYVITYIGRVDGSVTAMPWSEGSWLGAVAHEQHDMYVTHTQTILDATHSYQSPAWSWILLKRPVAYFYEVNADGKNQEILALGNPFVWWASIAAVVVVTVAWIRRLFRREAYGRPEGLIVAGVFFTFAPWLVQQTGRGAVFIFYLLPTVPFMCLALAYCATRIGNSWEARAAIALFVAMAIGLFAFFFPVLTKRPLPPEQWKARIWFDEEDCRFRPTTTPVTSTETRPGGQVIIRTTDSTTQEGKPPRGWCWI